jgi:hypothetical protein
MRSLVMRLQSTFNFILAAIHMGYLAHSLIAQIPAVGRPVSGCAQAIQNWCTSRLIRRDRLTTSVHSENVQRYTSKNALTAVKQAV